MDGERLLINFGVIMGFLAITSFWIGLSMWMRVDADKRGLPGYLWIFVGLVTGPVGLIGYILFRGNRPVLPVVHTRDELISETHKAHHPVDFTPDDPDAAAESPVEIVPEDLPSPEPFPESPNPSK